jgi:hypothetical protein
MADPGLTSDILSAAAAAATPKPAADAEQVTQRKEGDVLEARSTSRRIKTVDDLLAHIEADMINKWDVAASEATKWEVATAGEDGEPTVTELHRVWVRLKPKAGPGIKEAIEAMIAGANLPRTKQKAIKENIELAKKSGNVLTQTLNDNGDLIGVRETVDFDSRDVAETVSASMDVRSELGR